MPSDNYPPGPPGGGPSGGGYGGPGGNRPRLEPGFFSRQDQEPFPGQDQGAYSQGGGRRTSLLKNRPLLALVSIAVFGIIVWYAYEQGHDAGSVSVPPIIKSDVNPTRVRPQSPGGMEVPHQDKLVYDRVSPGSTDTQVERLLPPPEAPLQRQTSPSSALPGADGRFAPAAPDAKTVPAPSFPQTGQMKDIPVPTVPEVPPPQIIDEDAAAPPPAAAPRQLAPSPAPLPSVTQAPPAAAPAPAPAPAPASTGAFKVQLGALRSDADARGEWARLQKGNRDLLGGLSLTVQSVDLGAKGTFFRIKAGPLADEAAARTLCAELSKRKIACLITR